MDGDQPWYLWRCLQVDIRSLSPAQLNCKEEKTHEFVKATVVTASVSLYERSWFQWIASGFVIDIWKHNLWTTTQIVMWGSSLRHRVLLKCRSGPLVVSSEKSSLAHCRSHRVLSETKMTGRHQKYSRRSVVDFSEQMSRSSTKWFLKTSFLSRLPGIFTVKMDKVDFFESNVFFGRSWNRWHCFSLTPLSLPPPAWRDFV